jgi:hypothetical protein
MVLAAGARDHVENHFLIMALNRAIRWRGVLGVAVLAAGLAPVALAQGKGGKVREELLQKDFPFQGACINANFPGDNVAMKGLAIRVGNDAAMLFDTDLLRFAAGWTGGFIDTRGVVFDGGHGNHPAIVGEQRFGAAVVPGVAGPDGIFKDTRSEPYGPISQKLARWDGMAVDGMAVQLDYTVLGTRVHEQPSSVASGGDVAFVRVIQVDPPKGGGLLKRQRTPETFSLLLATVKGGTISVDQTKGAAFATWKGEDGAELHVAATALPANASVRAKDGHIALEIPKGTSPSVLKVTVWSGKAGAAEGLRQLASAAPVPKDFSKGGAPHWPEPVVLKGQLNASSTPDGAYVTDTITSPEKNPWNRRVRFGGMDFFSDGNRAALCTHDGDIWIVSGLDNGLEKLEWRRFASGLYEPLGLEIVNDVIYVSGRDGITRFRDVNNDGSADYYENFNNEVMSTEGFHEFVFDLQTDAAGNFYFVKANPVNGGGRGFGNQKASRGNGTVCSHAGALFKVSPDGKKFEVVARGFRAPNGIGVRADGQVTTSDNEGTWVPTTPLNWVDGKAFHGVINDLTPKDLATKFAPPILWLSHNDYDNSGGGQVWVTSDKWGPFKGELLHESYGKSSLYLVMRQDIGNGSQQAGVVKIPVKFTSSAMRARFNPRDGQLYVAGLSEWQSNAARITGFDRVRYTGKPVYSVSGLKVTSKGVDLTFSQPLDRASAEDLQNWSGKRWNYVRSENYGSPEIGVKDPSKKGRETINITGAKLSADGKTVSLTIEDVRPVMQQAIKWDLKAQDGTPVAQETQHTIHVVPGVASVN